MTIVGMPVRKPTNICAREPCDTAISGLFLSTKGKRRRLRAHVPNIFRRRFLPQCPPKTLHFSPWSSRSSHTWYEFLADKINSYPRLRSSSMIGTKNGTWGELSKSIQILLFAKRGVFELRSFIKVVPNSGRDHFVFHVSLWQCSIVKQEFLEKLRPMHPIIPTLDLCTQQQFVVPTVYREPRQKKSNLVSLGTTQNRRNAVCKAKIQKHVLKKAGKTPIFFRERKRIRERLDDSTCLLLDCLL